MSRTVTKRTGRIASWVTPMLLGIVAVPVAIGVYGNLPSDTSKPVKPQSAWQKVEPHLDQLDQAATGIAEKHLSRISAFFNEKKGGAKAFSEWAYSWRAKFYLVKGKLQGDDGAGFRQWLHEKFEENVFKSEDLQAVLTSAIEGYVTEMQGLEQETLVRIRADIAQNELFQGNMPQLQTDQAFRDEYHRLAEEVLPKVLDDLKIGLAGQVTNFAVSEVAARALGPGLAGPGLLRQRTIGQRGEVGHGDRCRPGGLVGTGETLRLAIGPVRVRPFGRTGREG